MVGSGAYNIKRISLRSLAPNFGSSPLLAAALYTSSASSFSFLTDLCD